MANQIRPFIKKKRKASQPRDLSFLSHLFLFKEKLFS